MRDINNGEPRIYKNLLLGKLEKEVIARLNLRPVVFEMGYEIETPGRPITHLFFVEEGMASVTTSFQDGSQVEVGTFGYESVIGISAMRHISRAYFALCAGAACAGDAIGGVQCKT
jgi:CRP-like cAMP-binding protein